MTTKLTLVLLATILISCSASDKKVETTQNVTKTLITKKEYYSNGKLMSASEMTSDSILNGLTIWYDSIGRKYGEQNYLQSKLNGLTKTFYENGQLAKETAYLNDSIIKEKEYNLDGTLIYEYPIKINEIGKIKVIIANNVRHYFIKNTADTIQIASNNLPQINKIISVKNAKFKAIGNDKYILTPLDKNKFVKIILQLKKHKNDLRYINLDSTEIEIK